MACRLVSVPLVFDDVYVHWGIESRRDPPTRWKECNALSYHWGSWAAQHSTEEHRRALQRKLPAIY
eukprot:COSAG02_NODE_9245_length_2279_cov_1.650459_2_plen_66_part_00